VNLDFQIFERHTITEITIKPVRFLHNHAAGVWILLKEAHHLPKALSPRGFGGFDIHKFLDDCHFIADGVFPQQLQLCGNGISLPLLVLA
jgi:hypothetical protein